MADGRWWRPGTVSGATRALQCLWHEVRVDERTQYSFSKGWYRKKFDEARSQFPRASTPGGRGSDVTEACSLMAGARASRFAASLH
eukprot:6254068-Prymnesium_polylepis.1